MVGMGEPMRHNADHRHENEIEEQLQPRRMPNAHRLKSLVRCTHPPLVGSGGRDCLTGAHWSAPRRLQGASTRHLLELRDVERLDPFGTALHEHFELRLYQFRTVEASQLNEDKARKTLQIAGV